MRPKKSIAKQWLPVIVRRCLELEHDLIAAVAWFGPPTHFANSKLKVPIRLLLPVIVGDGHDIAEPRH